MNEILPVILAGGVGTRLWPLSRKSYPKQFSKLIGGRSLFQQSALRMQSTDVLNFASPLTMTNSEFRFIVGEQLQKVGIDPGPIFIEPEGRNTAPAILAASIFAFERDKNSILLVAPSDHVIPETEVFHEAIHEGLRAAFDGKIVTFGIAPTRPETGYGYLELFAKNNGKLATVKRFTEKPDLESAQSMLSSGSYLWNSGIYMFRADTMISAFEKDCAELIPPVRAALNTCKKDLDFLRIPHEEWARCADISIDYAVMEQANNLVAIPFSAKWSDLGSWESVLQAAQQDRNGVVVTDNAHAIECSNTLLRSESSAMEVVGLGLKDMIVVAMPDAVLVAHKDQTQDVKKVVSKLKAEGVPQAETFPKDHRPWGWFETLAIRDRFQVKKIFVKPGAALSLQSHHHRSEHWVVVEGTAEITLEDQMKLVSEGESVYIPLGAKHRLKNPGKVPMLLIEVQTGRYLGEDDIIRYEDLYERPKEI